MASTRAQREAAERLRRNNEYLEEKYSGKGTNKAPVYATGEDKMSSRPSSYKTASQARYEANRMKSAKEPSYANNAARNARDIANNIDPYAWQNRGSKTPDYKAAWGLTGIFDALDSLRKEKEKKADSVSTGARMYSEAMKQQGGEIAALDQEIERLSPAYEKENATKETALETMLAEDDPVVIRGKQAIDAMSNGIVTDQIRADAEAYRKLQEQYKSSPVGKQKADLTATKKAYSDAYDAAGYQYAAQNAADYIEGVQKGKAIDSDVNRVLEKKYTQAKQTTEIGLGIDDDKIAYATMTQDEVDTYRYWLEKSEEAAKRYIKLLKPQLIERASDIVDQDIIEGIDNEAQKKIVRGFTTFAGAAKNSARALQNIPAAVTGSEDVKSAGIVERGQQKMAQRLEGVEKGVNDFIYNATQMLPTAAISMVPGAGPALSAGYTAARSYGGTYADTIEQGYSPEEAMRYAAANAASEAGMQYLLGGIARTGGSKSLSSVLERAAQKAASNPLAAKGLTILGNMGSEAAEEYLQANLDPILRNAILDEDNKIDPLSPDKIEAAVMGGLMALAMNAPADISEGVQASRMGKAYNSPDVMQALVEQGLASSTDQAAYGQAQRIAGKLDAGKRISNYEAGALAQANEAAITAEARANAILDKVGVNRIYNPNEIVRLANGKEAVVVERDGGDYVIAESGKSGYSRVRVDDITGKVQSASPIVDRFIPAEKKAGLNDKYDSRHVEKTADQTFIDKLTKGRGVKAVVEDMPTGVEAFYDRYTDTMHIARGTTRADAIAEVTAHELSHAAETSPHYTKYSDYVIGKLFGGDGAALRQAIEAKQEQYISHGIDLSDADATAELVADYTRTLYKSEADIDALVTGNRSMAQNIYDSIKTAVRKIRAFFKGDEATLANLREYQELRRAQRLFEKALSTREIMQEAQMAYALNPNFEAEYDAWDGKSRGGYFKIGNTSDVLKSIGVKDQNIYWDKSKIADIKKKHTDMTDDVIKAVPQLLEDPVIVMQSNTVANRIVMLGEVYDAAGNPVLVALELKPTGKNAEIQDFSKIASAYGKKNVQNLLNTSDILYLDPNKKRTNRWLEARLGLQLPAGLTNYGSIGNVTYVNKDVNGKITFDDGSGKTTMEIAMEEAKNRKYSIKEDITPFDDADVPPAQMEYIPRVMDADIPAGKPEYIPSVTDTDVPAGQSEYVPKVMDKDIPAARREYIPKPMDNAAPPETIRDQQTQTLRNALEEGHKISPEEFKTASLIHKDAAEEFAAVDKRLGLTADEKEAGKQIAKGHYDLGKFNGDPKVLEWAEAYERRGNAERVMHQYRMDLRKTAREKAAKVIASSDMWKDKKLGLSYATETAYRNNIDIAGKYDAEGAKRLQREYFDPIAENEAKATRYINELNEKIKALDLNKAEAVLVQAYGEGLVSDAELAGYAREPIKKIAFQNEENLYQKEFKKAQKVDADKVKNAAGTFRGIYDELMELANDARVRNGYAPITPRANYFPHFNEMTTKEKALAAFGIDITGADAIPEGLAGITEFFKPGTKWFANFQQREGSKTAFDAVEGFDGYIRGIKDVIFHTDDIQNLRALETALRSRHADETIQQRIDEINADPTRTAESKQSDIQELLKNVQDSNLSNYISWLHEYTNGIAGKKAALDREMERMGNRKAYTVMRKLQGRVASNMIGYNVGSWLTNFIPLAQAHGQIKTVNMLKGIRDTIKNWAKNDGFVQNSDFLVNRRGTDTLSKDALRKFSDAGVKPMEWIDQFVSETIVRAKYTEEVKGGATPEEAMRTANQTAANILADRSYGQMPTLFNAKNPLIKTFSMFQLEVNNQYRNLFKDLPRSAKGSGGNATLTVAIGLLKYCVGAWLYNELYEKMTGRRAAFDPIGMVKDAAEDFSDKNMTKAQAATNTVSNLLEQVPFIGGAIGGGRVPISSAIPYGGNISDIVGGIAGKAEGNENAGQNVAKELAKPLWYILPPGGGGAAKKAVEGAQAITQGGEYGVDSEGNKKLKFATDGDVFDALRALVFGKYATEGGQEYINNGFKGLSAAQTTAHTNLVNSGVKPKRAEEAIKAIGSIEGDKDENGEAIEGSKSKKIIDAIDQMNDLNAGQKYGLYYDMVWGDSLKENMDVAKEDYGIGEMTLINAYKKTYGIKGDKDENGETISGTKGKKIRDAIDSIPLSGTEDQKERQRQFLYEMFGAGKTGGKATVETEAETRIKEAAGYELPNYKTETLEKIASIGVSPEDYAYIDDRISAHEDKVAYLQELGFTGGQLNGLVESFVMGKTAKNKMRVAEEDMSIDNSTYIDAYVFGYSSVGSKNERNAQIKEYVNGLPLSDDQKAALYDWVKVSSGKTADGKQTGGSSGGSGGRRRGSGGRSGAKSGGSQEPISQAIPDSVWNEMRSNVKTSTIKYDNPVWAALESLFDDGDRIREETMKQELAAVDAIPFMSNAMRAERKKEIRKRYERGMTS